MACQRKLYKKSCTNLIRWLQRSLHDFEATVTWTVLIWDTVYVLCLRSVHTHTHTHTRARAHTHTHTHTCMTYMCRWTWNSIPRNAAMCGQRDASVVWTVRFFTTNMCRMSTLKYHKSVTAVQFWPTATAAAAEYVHCSLPVNQVCYSHLSARTHAHTHASTHARTHLKTKLYLGKRTYTCLTYMCRWTWHSIQRNAAVYGQSNVSAVWTVTVFTTNMCRMSKVKYHKAL